MHPIPTIVAVAGLALAACAAARPADPNPFESAARPVAAGRIDELVFPELAALGRQAILAEGVAPIAVAHLRFLPGDAVLKLRTARENPRGQRRPRRFRRGHQHAPRRRAARGYAAGGWRLYTIAIGDTARQGGAAYGYRLRLGAPQPDFELRIVPSSVSLAVNATTAVTVYAARRDGFAGPVPAGELQEQVFDPKNPPPPRRGLPARPAAALAVVAASPVTPPKPQFTKQQVVSRLRQLKLLYEEDLLSDDFYLDRVAECETSQ